MSAACNLHDVLKGGDLMVAALSALPASLKRDVVLLTFGDGAQAMSEKTGVRARGLGYVADDRVKAIAYSAADVFVSPSRSENFPTVVLEAMACGVPCVAFHVGGVPDLVRPGATGLLAHPEDAADLSRRVVQIIEDDTARRSMARACRERAVAEYDLGFTAGRYIDLYRQVLAAHAAPRVAQRSSPDSSAAREMARGWTAAARGEG
jgi:glycosyltransferase involved in cell wall biosynthesis